MPINYQDGSLLRPIEIKQIWFNRDSITSQNGLVNVVNYNDVEVWRREYPVTITYPDHTYVSVSVMDKDGGLLYEIDSGDYVPFETSLHVGYEPSEDHYYLDDSSTTIIVKGDTFIDPPKAVYVEPPELEFCNLSVATTGRKVSVFISARNPNKERANITIDAAPEDAKGDYGQKTGTITVNGEESNVLELVFDTYQNLTYTNFKGVSYRGKLTLYGVDSITTQDYWWRNPSYKYEETTTTTTTTPTHSIIGPAYTIVDTQGDWQLLKEVKRENINNVK